MKRIRVGGVPEHFNLPWHLAVEEGTFSRQGLEIEWKTYPGGTGAMTQALRNDECDLCVLLTEGIITDIARGNPSKIISQYVKTPLCWGVHTAADNPLDSYTQIWDKRYAISRYGSGSQLMAIVDAEGKGHTIDSSQWHVIKNIDGALQSLKALETDVFYWEKYTTKPLVDSGVLKRLGEYYTPWPCFVIAATDKILKEQPDNVIRLLRSIHEESDQFMQNPDNIHIVSERYGQKKKDVERWYHSTEWAIHGWVSDKMIDGVIYHLRVAGVLTEDDVVGDLIWKRD